MLRSTRSGRGFSGHQGRDEVADAVGQKGGSENHDDDLGGVEGIDHQQDSQDYGNEGREEQGNEDSGLDLNGGNDQRNLSHTVHQEKGAQHQREKAEKAMGRTVRKRSPPEACPFLRP